MITKIRYFTNHENFSYTFVCSGRGRVQHCEGAQVLHHCGEAVPPRGGGAVLHRLSRGVLHSPGAQVRDSAADEAGEGVPH